MPLAPGTRIQHFEILAPVGAGGMGEVYRARDTDLERDVALKILPQAFAGDSERMLRFEREAKTLAALNHPNIAHIHGVAREDSTRALVMELVDGRTLDRATFAIDEALRIGRDIADALEYAHERGIVHRDLKPANVMLSSEGVVKVLHFGLARAVAGDDRHRHHPRHRRLHGAGAGKREAGGPARRHLGPRRHPVRDALRPDDVLRRDGDRDDCPGHHTTARLERASRRHATVRASSAAQVPGKGAARPLSIRGGRPCRYRRDPARPRGRREFRTGGRGSRRQTPRRPASTSASRPPTWRRIRIPTPR